MSPSTILTNVIFCTTFFVAVALCIYITRRVTRGSNPKKLYTPAAKEKSAMGKFKEIMSEIADCSTAQYLPGLEDKADDFRARYYTTIGNDELNTYYDNMLEEIERRRLQLQGRNIIRSAVG